MQNHVPQQRAPKPRIKARLVPLPPEHRHVARCGSCGQILWTIIDGDGLRPSWLNDLKHGWRFDPGGRIWRPTGTHLAQRRAASARVRTGTAAAGDRVSLRYDLFGRRRTRPAHNEDSLVRHGRFDHFARADVAISPPHASRFGATADLPVAIQCGRCGAENDVEDPVAAPA